MSKNRQESKEEWHQIGDTFRPNKSDAFTLTPFLEIQSICNNNQKS